MRPELTERRFNPPSRRVRPISSQETSHKKLVAELARQERQIRHLTIELERRQDIECIARELVATRRVGEDAALMHQQFTALGEALQEIDPCDEDAA